MKNTIIEDCEPTVATHAASLNLTPIFISPPLISIGKSPV